MGVKIEGKVFDRNSKCGIGGIKILLINESGQIFRSETNNNGQYFFMDITQSGFFKLIECGSENFDLENIVTRNFKNSTSKKCYKFEITKQDLLYEKEIVNMNFSYDNDESFFYVKNHERVFISPIGDVFLINTFNGEVNFKFNVDIEFSNLNYNYVDKQYYFVKVENGVEIFRVSKDSNMINIGKIDNLEYLQIPMVISDISMDGILYFMNTVSDVMYSVSLNQNRIDFANEYSEVDGVIRFKQKVEFSAFTHNIVDGNIYGVDKNTNEIQRIDISGEVVNLTSSYDFRKCEISIMFSDELGYIYAIDNLTGTVYKLSISLNEVTVSILGEGINKSKKSFAQRMDVVKDNDVKLESISDIKIESILDNKIIKREYNVENGIASGKLYKNTLVQGIELIEDTKNGALSINKTNGGWTYIPNDGFEGIDNFRVCLSKEGNEKEEIDIIINSEEILEEVSISSLLECEMKTYSVLNNNSISDKIEIYVDGEFNYSIKKGGKKGIVQIDRRSGEWTYEPYYGVSGKDKFDILVSNKVGGYRIETIEIEILNPKFYVEQIADKESISFDDFIEYKIFIRNTGNVKAENVIVRGSLDTALLFEKGSLQINGIDQEMKNSNFIEIGDMEINEGVEITFRAFLNNIIEQRDVIESISNVRGEFRLSDYEEAKTFNFESNCVSTNILYGNISCEDIVFTADKSVTTIDDVIKFKVSFRNNGNTDIQKLVLKNLVAKGTMFEKNKIIINDEEYYFDIGNYGVILDGLSVNQTVTIEYSLKVIETDDDILDFTPVLEYEYLVDYRKKVRKLFFNTLSIASVVSKIDIQKYFNAENVIVGEHVRCNLVLKNIGNINAKNLVLKEYLDDGIIYNGNLIINGEKSELDINEGIEFPLLVAGQSIHISYESIIDMCPSSDLMSFNTDISYDYMVCSKLFEVNNYKKEAKLKVLKYDLLLETNFSKEKVAIGDEVDLEIKVINCGDTNLENVAIFYPLFELVDILDIKINQKKLYEYSGTEIKIGVVNSGETKNILLRFKSLNLIEEEQINLIEIEGDIKIDFNNTSKIRGRTKVEKILEVFEPKLIVQKTISKEFIVIGEEVEMCIMMQNRGNLVLEDVVLTDLLPDELEFIEGSVSVNNKIKENESIISGVNIDRISIDESVEVKCKFKAIKESNKVPNIEISAFTIYSYNLNGEVFSKNIKSNICILNISKVEIEIQKRANKEFVKLGDEVTFEITLINTGVKDALNVLFIDELFDGIELVNRSFSIEGEFVNNVNVKKGIIIGDIKAAGMKKISYKVKIIKTSSKLDLNTKTFVKYSYILLDGSNGRKVSNLKRKNLESVDIALANFRQVDKDEYLKIPCEKPEIGEIDGVSASVEVLSTHIIKTPIVSSIEGQILTGYKLLINGYISETVEYTSRGDSQVMYSTSYEIPFSDYIIMPVDFNINSRVEVEGKVENVYYKRLNGREFFNNATLLLVAKILSA